MELPFPFGFPIPTAFYLTLFVVTLVLHVLFMNYVLAGTAWLAWSIVVGRVRLGPKSAQIAKSDPATSESILADWIPSMLSGAITAGVAPLLFVQILYQREFYTANLLLFNRWMSILPVLIISFYSLYVLRSDWLTRRVPAIKIGTGLLPFLCVAFVAYSWTENHLLSVNSPEQWRSFYAQDRQFYFEPQIIPRLAVWAFGSIPTVCLWLAWQIRKRQVARLPLDPRSATQLPRVAIFGIVASVVGGVAYYLSAPQLATIFFGPMARWYLLLAVLGVFVQLVGWMRIRKSNEIDLRPLLVCSSGLLATLIGMSVSRESIRIASLGQARLDELIPLHAEAMKVDGFWVFLLFAAVNFGLILWCFRLVQSNTLILRTEKVTNGKGDAGN